MSLILNFPPDKTNSIIPFNFLKSFKNSYPSYLRAKEADLSDKSLNLGKAGFFCLCRPILFFSANV